MIRPGLALVAAGLVALLISACSEPALTEDTIVGIVTEVTGDSSSIESFVVLDAKGDSHKFSPSQTMEVAGEPQSHLRDYVVSGDPVEVTFHEGPDGELIADEVVEGRR